MTGLAAHMKNIVITIISQMGMNILYSLSISYNLFMKLMMGTSVMGGNLLITKLDFVIVTFVSLMSEMNLNSNMGPLAFLM